MHLSYESQLQSKRASVVSQLSKIGGIPRDRAEELVGECVGSKRQLGYRNKLGARGGRATNAVCSCSASTSGEASLCTPKPAFGSQGIESTWGGTWRTSSYLQGRDLIWAFFRIGVRSQLRTKIPKSRSGRTLQHFPEKPQLNTLSSALKCTSIVRNRRPRQSTQDQKVEALSERGHWSEELALGKHLPHQRPEFLPSKHRPSRKDDPVDARRAGS